MRGIQLFSIILLTISLAGCTHTAPNAYGTESLSTGPTESTTLPPEASTTRAEPVQQLVPDEADFVLISDHIPDIAIDLRYAGDENFTKQQIYRFTAPWLRYGTVRKLQLVQSELLELGLSLKIWDAFRPLSAQYTLWNICPDPTYVSDPRTGSNSHSRGNTVDVTLINLDGTELIMPTGFDDFSLLADRDYSDCLPEAAANARLLEDIMTKHGFKPYYGEWWHFSDTDTYKVDPDFEPCSPQWYYAYCREYISLRSKADTGADVITKIPSKAKLEVVATCNNFALVRYEGLYGYVLKSYIQPTEDAFDPTTQP